MIPFTINAMGETFRGDDLIVGSVSIPELRERLARDPTQDDIDDEFDRLAAAALTAEEYALYRAHGTLLPLGTDLFRFYAFIHEGTAHEGRIDLETEFIAFTDDVPVWNAIALFVRRVKGTMTTMIEDPHLDQWKHEGDAEWTTGPNHGRMERQVDVSVEVTGMTTVQVAALIEQWRVAAKHTGAADYWVSVI